MAAAISTRGDFNAGALRAAARRSKDGPQARRLLALAAIYDGPHGPRRPRSTASACRSFGIGCSGSMRMAPMA